MMTKIIMLTLKDQRTVEVLTKLISKDIKVSDAMKLLGLSKRQILRKKKKLLRQGASSIPHGNRGQVVKHGISDLEKQQLIDLYRKEYAGWNFSHFHETIVDSGQTTRSLKSISRILIAEDISSPQAHRHQRKIHPPRARKEFAGEMTQVDASEHQWLPNDLNYYHLHGGIDDATGNVVGAYLMEQETIYGYQMVLKQEIAHYGIPGLWYTDYRTVFQSTRKSLTIEEELVGKKLKVTRFSRMAGTLGIEIKSTRSPQAKGKIERLWRTFQDRLVKELIKHSITTLEAANKFIQNDFIPRFNARFALPIQAQKSKYTPVSNNFDPNYQLATYEEKSLYRYCYLKHQKQLLVVLNPINHKPIGVYTKGKIRLYTLLDGTFKIQHQDKFYPVKIVSQKQLDEQLGKSTTANASNVCITTTTAASTHTQILQTSKNKSHPWRSYSPNWLKSKKSYRSNYR
jgi:hypothetical protein